MPSMHIEQLERVMGVETDRLSQEAEAILAFIKGFPDDEAVELLGHSLAYHQLVEATDLELNYDGLSKDAWESLLNSEQSKADEAQLQKIFGREKTYQEKISGYWQFLSGLPSDRAIFNHTMILKSDLTPMLTDEEKSGAVRLKTIRLKKIANDIEPRGVDLMKIRASSLSLQRMASAALKLLEGMDREQKAVLLMGLYGKALKLSLHDDIHACLEYRGIGEIDLNELPELKNDSSLTRQELIIGKIIMRDDFEQRTESTGAALKVIESRVDNSRRIILMMAMMIAIEKSSSKDEGIMGFISKLIR